MILKDLKMFLVESFRKQKVNEKHLANAEKRL